MNNVMDNQSATRVYALLATDVGRVWARRYLQRLARRTEMPSGFFERAGIRVERLYKSSLGALALHLSSLHIRAPTSRWARSLSPRCRRGRRGPLSRHQPVDRTGRPHVIRLRSELNEPGATLVSPEEFTSSSFRRVFETLHRFERDPSAAILLEGESGTGKTAIARHIHRHSGRSAGPFGAITLSAIDDSLCGSELFGHARGAFTGAVRERRGLFASSDSGTVLLDEIGKASAAVQQRLLNIIEYREFRPVGSDEVRHVDVRVIAASNVSLETMANDGRFLPDLHARLQLFRIVLPPLRDRRADIRLLVERYVAAYARRISLTNEPSVDDTLMAALLAAPWPNNVRQLAGTIQRLLIEADGADVITLDHCRDDLAYLRGERRETSRNIESIRDALRSTDGNVSEAARQLGVDRRTVQRRCKNDSALTGRKEAVSA